MICPNCNAPTLQEAGKLTPWYYCTTCHRSFDTQDLTEYGLDIADFFNVPTLETLDPVTSEPVWYSEAQRVREYQTVDEMEVGPVEDNKVDYGYPIGWGG